MKKLLIIGLVLILGLPVLAQEKPDSSNILLNGQKMPEFTITDMDGKAVQSTSLKGKVVLVNFFATWCGPCRKELPFVQKEIWNKYKDNPDFLLLIISREERPEKVKPFVAEYSYTMPFYSDIDRSCYKQFAVQKIPRNYLFDKTGTLIYQSTSFTEKEFTTLLEKIASQLQ